MANNERWVPVEMIVDIDSKKPKKPVKLRNPGPEPLDLGNCVISAGESFTVEMKERGKVKVTKLP